jgi:hypothetical protein
MYIIVKKSVLRHRARKAARKLKAKENKRMEAMP